MSYLLQNYITPIAPETLATFEARGFDAEELLSLNLGIGEYTERPGCIAIPYRQSGLTTGIATGNLQAGLVGLQHVQRLGDCGVLYNADCLSDATLSEQSLIITDGILDCLAAMVSGFRRCVAVPPATVADGRDQPLIEAARNVLRDVSQIVIATFDDEHGQRLRANLAEALGSQRCKWLSYPKGCSDLSGTLRTYRARGVQEAISRAKWFAMPGFYSMSELPDTLKLNGTIYRLWGIDAPEVKQDCPDGWPAGRMATTRLLALIQGKTVVCEKKDTDRYGRTVAICRAAGEDLGALMVRDGMAWAFVRYSADYVGDEAKAKATGLGVHAHGCVPAWEWRAEQRR